MRNVSKEVKKALNELNESREEHSFAQIFGTGENLKFCIEYHEFKGYFISITFDNDFSLNRVLKTLRNSSQYAPVTRPSIWSDDKQYQLKTADESLTIIVYSTKIEDLENIDINMLGGYDRSHCRSMRLYDNEGPLDGEFNNGVWI